MINSTTEISQKVFIKKPITTSHLVGWLLFKQQQQKTSISQNSENFWNSHTLPVEYKMVLPVWKSLDVSQS